MTDVSERPRINDAAASAVVELELPADRPFAAVFRLVAAGLAGRHDVTVDRIDELQLAIDAVLRQPPAAETISMHIEQTTSELRFDIGPIAMPSGGRVSLERVLSTLVAGARTRHAEDQTWIEMPIPLPEAERA